MNLIEVRGPSALIALFTGALCLAVAFALFKGWNPDQLPQVVRFIQAVLASVFAAVFFAAALIGAVQTLQRR